MKEKFNKYLFYYLTILLFFSVIYLIEKHDVGNDSTIAEWIINYEGGFTKRGLIGQISIFLANIFNIGLRDAILIFQIILIIFYFVLIIYLFKNLKINKLILLSVFTPIFILYPVAEIEVLARKEVFIFCIFIIYILIDSILLRNFFKLIFLPISILIWEPVIFYFLFFVAVDIIKNNFKKIDKNFFFNSLYYLPALIPAFIIALNPLTAEEHSLMVNFLKQNFNEGCYTACELLKTKSSVYDQFQGNFKSYSFEVFFRYSLIILIGFGPLLILLKNSFFINKDLFFFKHFNDLLKPILILYTPVIFLFAMGVDWGRWVNISYVFGIILYIYLYQKEIIKINVNLFQSKFYNFLNNKKIFIFIFVIFCFTWNPKTVITGDIATNPLWKIPYNASKIIFGFDNFRIFQNHPLIIWHKKYIE